MKTTILFFMTFFLIASCTKDKSTSSQLPPETQTGANTFGVTINGKVYIPRDPTGFSTFPSTRGMIFWLAPDDISWNELEIKDGASAIRFNMWIHIQNLKTLGVGKYVLHNSNFHNSIDSTPFNHIYFEIWNSSLSNFVYYGSVENQGEINITKNSNYITSCNFKGKFVRYDNPNEFITITDGRFDIGPGLHDKVFP